MPDSQVSVRIGGLAGRPAHLPALVRVDRVLTSPPGLGQAQSGLLRGSEGSSVSRRRPLGLG
jgi:hypothetical protein